MSSPQIQKEHAIETYKSLVQISVEGIKLLALLNGDAAVALLAYLGNLAGKTSVMPDMRYSMAFFFASVARMERSEIRGRGTLPRNPLRSLRATSTFFENHAAI